LDNDITVPNQDGNANEDSNECRQRAVTGESIVSSAMSQSTRRSSRSITTHDVVTLWYRAPEVVLSETYSFGVDVFAAGCIIAELVSRQVLFMSRNDDDHIDRMMCVLGVPSEEDLQDYIMEVYAMEQVAHGREYFNRERPDSFKDGRTYWPTVFGPCAKIDNSRWTAELTNLLDNMLCYNLSKRSSVVEILGHPYYAEVRDEKVETDCKEEVD